MGVTKKFAGRPQKGTAEHQKMREKGNRGQGPNPTFSLNGPHSFNSSADVTSKTETIPTAAAVGKICRDGLR